MQRRETTLFFSARDHEKKREIPFYTFSTGTGQNVFSLSLFRLFCLSFSSVSLSKKQHPERESRERERALAFLVFSPPHTPAVLEKVIKEKTTREKT